MGQLDFDSACKNLKSALRSQLKQEAFCFCCFSFFLCVFPIAVRKLELVWDGGGNDFHLVFFFASNLNNLNCVVRFACTYAKIKSEWQRTTTATTIATTTTGNYWPALRFMANWYWAWLPTWHGNKNGADSCFAATAVYSAPPHSPLSPLSPRHCCNCGRWPRQLPMHSVLGRLSPKASDVWHFIEAAFRLSGLQIHSI